MGPSSDFHVLNDALGFNRYCAFIHPIRGNWFFLSPLRARPQIARLSSALCKTFRSRIYIEFHINIPFHGSAMQMQTGDLARSSGESINCILVTDQGQREAASLMEAIFD